jgi:hypothetical protein
MASNSSILKSLKLANTLPAVTVGSLTAGLQAAGLNPFEGSLAAMPTMMNQPFAEEPSPEPAQNSKQVSETQKPQENQTIDPVDFLSHFVPLDSGSDFYPKASNQSSENQSLTSQFAQPNQADHFFGNDNSTNADTMPGQAGAGSSPSSSKSSTHGGSSSGGGGSDSSSSSSSSKTSTTTSTDSIIDSSTDTTTDTSTDTSVVTDDSNTLLDGGQIFISNGEDTYLQGTSYNDTLIGDINGTDILIGGAGDDTYVVSSSNQSLVEDAGGGIDTVITSVSGLSAYRGIEILEVDDQASSYSSALNIQPFTQGSSFSFELNGGFDTQTITGGQGSDVLSSNGTSTLMGGLGDDVYVFTGSELIIENAVSGSDSVLTYASLTLPDNVEYVVSKSDSDISLGGNSLSNILVGNTSDNLLSGGAGDDTLVSMGGEDELIGGTGTDTFILSTNEIAYITDYEPGEAIIFALNEPPTSMSQVDAFTSSGSSDAAEWTYSDSTLMIDWNGDGSSDSMVIFGTNTTASDLEISFSSSFTSIL